jgi:hypothetical protein
MTARASASDAERLLLFQLCGHCPDEREEHAMSQRCPEGTQRATKTGVRAKTVSGLSDWNQVTGTENVAVIARSTL